MLVAGPTHVLPRNASCVECRRLKMRCDAQKPYCGPCVATHKTDRCEFRATVPPLQKLQDRVAELEAQIRAAEVGRGSSKSTHLSSSLSPAATSDRHSKSESRSPSLSVSTWPDSSSPSASFSPPSTGCPPPDVPNLSLSAGPSSKSLQATCVSHQRPPRTLLVPDEKRSPVGCMFPHTTQEVIKALQAWDPNSEMDASTKGLLLSIFLIHRDQFSPNIELLRVAESIQLPASHPSAIHPALSNAVFMAACSVCGHPDIAPFEALFLQRTRDFMSESLAQEDHLVDFLWASCLLSWYLYRWGRVTEAHAVNLGTTQFAIACQLHQIPSHNYQHYLEVYDQQCGGPTPCTRPLLDRPSDQTRLEERIRLWWSIFLIDRSCSLASGIPGEVPRTTITTVWPNALPQTLPGRPESDASLPHLYHPGTRATTVTHDSLLSLQTKSISLLDDAIRIAYFSTNPDVVLDPHTPTRPQIYHALTTFRQSMPSFCSRFPNNKASPEPELKGARTGVLAVHPPLLISPTMLVVHATIHTALIVLHRSAPEVGELKNAVASARMIARSCRALGEVTSVYAFVCLGSRWYAAAETLVTALVLVENGVQSFSALNGITDFPALAPRCATELSEEDVKDIRNDLEAVLTSLSQLAGFYPCINVYIERISDLLNQEGLVR